MKTVNLPADVWERIERQTRECLNEARKHGLEHEDMVELLRWAAAWKAVAGKRAQIVEGRMAVLELVGEIDRLIETYGDPNLFQLRKTVPAKKENGGE